MKRIIKYIVEVIFNFNMFFKKKTDGSKIFLFLTPQYLNYGDHAIAEMEKKFFVKNFPEYTVEEINYSFFQYWPELVQKRVSEKDVIVITGGGYTGDIWKENQEQVEKVIKMFGQNKIIFAPQTIFYTDIKGEMQKRFHSLLNQHKEISFIAREMNSFRIMEKHFDMKTERNLFLMPDFVLSSYQKGKDNKKNVGFCFRSDHEKILSDEKINAIRDNFKNKEIETITMARDHVEIPVWLRSVILKRKFKEFQKQEVVITDRLHGMIFSAITETPCVALDNITHKVSGVYETMKQLSYIRVVQDPGEVNEAVACVTKVSQEIRKAQLSELNKKVEQRGIEIFRKIIDE